MAQYGDENTPPKRRREEVPPLKPSVRKRVEEWELGDEPLQLIRCAFCGRPGNRYSQGHSRPPVTHQVMPQASPRSLMSLLQLGRPYGTYPIELATPGLKP